MHEYVNSDAVRGEIIERHPAKDAGDRLVASVVFSHYDVTAKAQVKVLVPWQLAGQYARHYYYEATGVTYYNKHGYEDTAIHTVERYNRYTGHLGDPETVKLGWKLVDNYGHTVYEVRHLDTQEDTRLAYHILDTRQYPNSSIRSLDGEERELALAGESVHKAMQAIIKLRDVEALKALRAQPAAAAEGLVLKGG